MTTEEALSLIDKTLAQVRESRTVHRRLEEALAVITKALFEK